MEKETSEDPAVASPPVRKTRFRTYKPISTVTPEQARRQSDVLRSACRHFSGQAAIAFLNGFDEGLGGSPLQIAMDSDEGLARVEQLLKNPVCEAGLQAPHPARALP